MEVPVGIAREDTAVVWIVGDGAAICEGWQCQALFVAKGSDKRVRRYREHGIRHHRGSWLDGQPVKTRVPTLSCALAAKGRPTLKTIMSKHLFNMRLFFGFISVSIDLLGKCKKKI